MVGLILANAARLAGPDAALVRDCDAGTSAMR